MTAWRPNANNPVHILSFAGDAIYAGGEFTSIGGESRAYAAAIDVTTKTLTAWNPRPDGPVNDLAFQNNTVYLAGSFGQVGGAVRSNLAAVDATTGTPSSWNPQTDQMVTGCQLFNNTLYLYGFFTNVNGQFRRSTAAVDALTGALKDWNPAPDGYVHALATDGRRVFLGGAFTAVGGQPRTGLAAVDPVTGAVAAWNPGITGGVEALVLSGNTLYAGGSFSLAANGQSRNGLAAFHTGTGQVKPWNPVLVNTAAGAATPGTVTALGLSGSTLYVGGPFTTAGGQVRKGVAGLDTTTAVPSPWNPALAGGILRTIVPAGDALYLGGDFTKVNHRNLPSLAAWHVNGPPPPRYNTIQGTVFEDKNRDCTANAGDAGMPDVVVVAEPGAHYALTDSLGRYTISADTGVYTVTQLLPSDKARLIREACPPARTVALKTYGNDRTGQDFGIRVTPCAFLDVQVASTERRRCAVGKTTIRYCNTGAAPAAGAKVYLKLPAHIVLVGADRSFTADKDKNYVFDVGTLEPGQCGILSVTDSVVCNDPNIRGLTQCTRVWITPANRCVEPSPDWDRSDVALRATCLSNGVVRLSLRNAGTGDMADSTEFRVRLDARLALTHRFKLAAGDSLILRVPANGQTVRLEADQHPAHPGKQSTSVTLEACGANAEGKVSTGYVAQLPPDDAEPEVAEDCQPIVDSFDPNDKLVLPRGVTDQHYTPTAVPLRYTVRFQNTGTASALRVVVVDTLSEHLDMRTFEPGVASHAYKLRVSGAGRPVLTFTFNNIALPDSTTDPLGSNGYVQFSIRPREGLPAKTRVENAADIVFDYNDPVRTNTVFNVLYDVPAAAFPPSQLKPATVIATPVITRFTPATGQAGTSVVISGRHFAPVAAGNAVAFNGIAATVTQATDTTLTVRVPTGEATGKITVVTPDGTAASATDFTVIPTPTPTPEPEPEPTPEPTPVPTALAPGLPRGTIQIYPNPAPGRFVVAFAAPMPPVRGIAVYNALGACVLRLPVTAPSLTHQEIRLPGHGPGMFVVVVTTDGGLVTRKVTIR